MERSRGFRAAALLLVLVCTLANAGVVGLCLHILGSSFTLEPPVERGGEACPWVVVPDAQADLGGETLCVRSLAGMELGPNTLVKDPGYLTDREAYRTWLEDQASLEEVLGATSSVELVLESQDGRRRALEVGVRSAGLSGKLAGLLPDALVVLVSLAIGSFVFLKRPGEAAARALFVITQGIAISAILTGFYSVRGLAPPVWASELLFLLNMAGLLAGAVGLFYLSATFPEPQLGKRTSRVALLVPLAVVCCAFALEIGGVFGASMWGLAPILVASVVLMLRGPLRSGSQLQRLEARWILWGLLLPVVAYVLTRVPLLLFPTQGAAPADDLLVISTLSIPGGIAVAVLRYRLLDIEVVIRRTILGAVVTLLVLFLYYLGVALFAGGLAGGAASTPMLYTVLVSALILTVVVGPIQAQLEGQLDRLFFRNRFHYRRVLARVPDGLALLNSSDAAAEHVLNSVGEAMELSRLVVVQQPVEGLPRVWTRSREGTRLGSQGPAVASPVGEALWEQVESLEKPHLCDREALDSPLDAWMLSEGLELALPLRTPVALVGMIASSGQAGGRLFSSEDIDALRSVASSLALAFSHALAYQTIRAMNEELEQRIDRRTAELDKVRLQLYQWEKMASLGVLAAGVAHELNTPLGVVLSAAEQLSEQLAPQRDEDEVTTRLLELCVEAARRASLIIGDLRSFSRPESSAVQSLDIHECITSTLRLLGPSLRAQKIEVTTEFGDISSVEGFPALFNQTLTNLILNAAAAIKSEGSIRITTWSESLDSVRMSIQDSGPGIPEDLRSRIFEPFYTTKAPGEGTGLGLSLCYTFITQHGGRIWEEGRPGEGARFVVELPVRMSKEQRAKARSPYELTPRPRAP